MFEQNSAKSWTQVSAKGKTNLSKSAKWLNVIADNTKIVGISLSSVYFILKRILFWKYEGFRPRCISEVESQIRIMYFQLHRILWKGLKFIWALESTLCILIEKTSNEVYLNEHNGHDINNSMNIWYKDKGSLTVHLRSVGLSNHFCSYEQIIKMLIFVQEKNMNCFVQYIDI